LPVPLEAANPKIGKAKDLFISILFID